METKPLLIYDGGCRFCCRWIGALKAVTGQRVEYASSQEAGGRFPQISPEEFERAVQWIGTDGSIRSGAEAVFLVLATSVLPGRLALALYRKVPLFARAAEAVYGVVAAHREFFSLVTRILWGNDVRPPTYAMSSWLFLRILGGIYFIAFLSFGAQIDGLIGSKGLLPATAFYEAAGHAAGNHAFWIRPGFLWWTGAGDAALHGWCWAGTISAALLFLGFAPVLNLLFLWAVYLSLTIAGQDFYQFQWDILLLETGFLAIFLAPWKWHPTKAVSPPRVAHFLLIWLLFRLLFESGMVKLASGDPTWASGTALDYHFFTQPLPTPVAWFAQHWPEWFHRLGVKATFFIELVLPFLLFFPRRLRLFAAGGIAVLQVMIALTGNYGFFNLLTAALCVLVVDDAVWGKAAAKNIVEGRFFPPWILRPVAAALFLLSLVPLAATFSRPVSWMEPLAEVYATVQPFRTINSYGLFAVMTTQRREILVQGSDDGLNWKTYGFRFKPGQLHRAPPWVAPYMPRLDWQMWFAALGGAERTPWFDNFMFRLLEGSPPVLDLMEKPPSFAGDRPRYVRALSDDYAFTTPAEKKDTGDWWKATPAAIYYPSISLNERRYFDFPVPNLTNSGSEN